MGAILAIIPTLYPLIKEGAGDIAALVRYVSSIRTSAKQSGEWTPEQESKFLETLIAHSSDPAYQPDKKLIA